MSLIVKSDVPRGGNNSQTPFSSPIVLNGSPVKTRVSELLDGNGLNPKNPQKTILHAPDNSLSWAIVSKDLEAFLGWVDFNDFLQKHPIPQGKVVEFFTGSGATFVFEGLINGTVKLISTSRELFSCNIGKEYMLKANSKKALVLGRFHTAPVVRLEIWDKKVRYERWEVASFKTTKGSLYILLPDGRSQRFKSAKNPFTNNVPGLQEIQDLLVFIKASPTDIEAMAYRNHDASGVTTIRIIDKRNGETISTNEAAIAAEWNLAIVYLIRKWKFNSLTWLPFTADTIGLLDNWDRWIFDVTVHPTIWLGVFDSNQSRRHVGNIVTEVTVKDMDL